MNLGNEAAGTSSTPLSVGDVAQGFIKVRQYRNHIMQIIATDLSKLLVKSIATKVANEAICPPIRALTQAKGHDTSKHVLACFGGAGGQHACDIARELGMKTVFVHRYLILFLSEQSAKRFFSMCVISISKT